MQQLLSFKASRRQRQYLKTLQDISHFYLKKLVIYLNKYIKLL